MKYVDGLRFATPPTEDQLYQKQKLYEKWLRRVGAKRGVIAIDSASTKPSQRAVAWTSSRGARGRVQGAVHVSLRDEGHGHVNNTLTTTASPAWI